MSDEERLATTKQLAYIERLSTDCKATIPKPLGELTMQEASEIIDELLERVNGSRTENGGGRNTVPRSSKRYDSWSNGARIGLAFKVVYQNWASKGANMFDKKDWFIQNVLNTYRLLNEIVPKTNDYKGDCRKTHKMKILGLLASCKCLISLHPKIARIMHLDFFDSLKRKHNGVRVTDAGVYIIASVLTRLLARLLLASTERYYLPNFIISFRNLTSGIAIRGAV